jgi:undecaprenyl-diphosphatase
MLGAAGLVAVCKTLIHRARPAIVPGRPFYSYPSGHALGTTALVGTLLVIGLPACRQPWQRGLLWSAAVAWSALMSASRVYLGYHYLTDVCGGMFLGTAWICFCQALLLARLQPLPGRKERGEHIAGATCWSGVGDLMQEKPETGHATAGHY